MHPFPSVSVLVCTYNRAGVLRQTLRQLAASTYTAEGRETIVVDNGSTDDTARTALEFAAAGAGAVRFIEEPTRGLSAARNRAIREARGDILIFLDDDALAPPGWVGALVEEMMRNDAIAAGGPVVPEFEGEPPAWLTDRLLPYLSAWDRGDCVHQLTYNHYPRGCNMAVRREAFQRYGDFATHFGRVGSSLLSCEEVEFFLRLERAGEKIIYVPQAAVRHLTSAGRLTAPWFASRFFAQGRSEAFLEWRHGGWSGLAAGARQMLRYLLGAQQRRRRSAEDRLYADFLMHCWLGHASGMVLAPFTVPRYERPGLASWVPS